MFKSAYVKLTLFYSLLFFLVFAVFSTGIYLWMEKSFGETYVTKVREHQQRGQNEGNFDGRNLTLVTSAADVALETLGQTLLIFNGFLLLVIPLASYFLARRTLAPIEGAHLRQRQFVSDASHEMRTPLAAISGEIEVSLRRLRSIQEYKNTLKSVKEETDRLKGLMESLLLLAREDQAGPLPFAPCDIADLLTSISALFKKRIESKKIKFHIELPQESLLVWGHEETLKILFSNILDNALKYTPAEGEINIQITAIVRFVKIRIQDTGVGIGKEHQKRIFDRFYRADLARSIIKGYGLGLAISKKIVDNHKGSIQIQSLRQGTAVIVNLPKAS